MNSSEPTTPAVPRRSWPRRLLNRLEVDKAVFFALALRFWQLLAGAVSLLLISGFLSREEQGFYYTFSSLLLLQMLFELGMHVVIVSHASHQWSRLRLDERGRVQGDVAAHARLGSLTRAVLRWYAAMSLLFVLGVGAAGLIFFRHRPHAGIDWQWPWLWSVVLTGVFLWSVPLHALLEGCGQVRVANLFRLLHAVASSLAVWVGLVVGAGLWVAVLATLMKLLCDAVMIGILYRPFFVSLWRAPAGPAIDWRGDIWPMQWRLAISVAFFYFESAVLTPVIFHYQGPVVAGQVGMTWNLISTLQLAALSWVQARSAMFGMLVAERDFRRLDQVFFRLVAISTVILAVACGGVIVGVICLHGLSEFSWAEKLADRLLPPWPTAVLALAAIVCHLPRSQDIYLRAHRREPQLLLNIVTSSLIGVLIWQLGGRYGPLGAALGMLAVSGLLTLPLKTWLWFRCRREWHGPNERP